MTGDDALDSQVEESKVILHGLDPLNSLKQLFIHRSQNVTHGQHKNKTFYEIIDNDGLKIFDAIEHNHKLSRNCCNDLRTFEISILQIYDQQEVLKLQRPFKGDCCCCFGCKQRMDVLSSPDNALIGSIVQEWSICRPTFAIKLPNGEMLFRATGPCCTMRCCVRELNFEVCTYNRIGDVALISSQWAGSLRDEFSEVNFYGVEFHQEVATKMKALILGACFLVNALYYKI